MPMSIIRESIHLIAEPLASHYQLVYHGIVPDQMKIARVGHLWFKTDDQSCLQTINRFQFFQASQNFLKEVVFFWVIENFVFILLSWP